MTLSKTYDLIVVGAGISGLTLANKIAKSGKKVLVLEGKEQIGGCLTTHYHSENDFWVEMGAHTFYATYANLIEILQSNDLEGDIVAREKVGMKVFTDKHEKIFSKIGKWNLISSVPNLFFSKRDGKTVKEYFSKIVGKRNYDNLFTRMFSAVIVQNADNFTAEYFLKRRKTKSKEHPKSFILKEGMQSFMQRLTDEENIEVLSNEAVVEVVKDQEIKVKTLVGNEFQAKDIAFAMSPENVAGLVTGINPSLSNRLKEFPTQNILSRGVVLPKNKINFEPVSFIIPLQGPCFSMVTRDVMSHEDSRGFAFHFEDGQISKEEQEKFMAELLLIDKSDITETVEARHKLPLLTLGHKERIEDIQKLAEESGIYLTGNYFSGLSLEDCVERSVNEFERYKRNNS